MAKRFIVNEKDIEIIDDKTLKIHGDDVKHIQVLRHKIGDKITINNNLCEINKIMKESIELEIIDEAKKVGEPSISLTIYQAYLKSDKMDFVVQKQVELGIKKIVPFLSQNVVVKLDEKDRLKKQERLQKIADEACKQCGRTDTVIVEQAIEFVQMLEGIDKHEVVIFAYEKEISDLKSAMKKIKENKIKNIAIIVGAEGGFSEKEAEKIIERENVQSVSLGERILRAETASIYLSSIIKYEMND